MQAPPNSAGEDIPLLQQQHEQESTTVVIAPEITADQKAGAVCSSKTGSCSGINSNDSSGCTNNSSVLGTCRICFETETAESEDPTNPLICPCMCSGSSKYVHRQCLSQWRNTNHREDASYQCEVCKYRYQYRRLWWAGLIGSRVTLITLYVTLMTALITALGFIPITPKGGISSSSGSSSSSGGGSSSSDDEAPVSGPVPLWVLVVAHVMNGLCVMGLGGLLLAALVHITAIARQCLGRDDDDTDDMGEAAPDTCGTSWLQACVDRVPLLGGFRLWQCVIMGHFGMVVVFLVVLMRGALIAAYTLYAGLWVLLQRGLDRAQCMVENVQQEPPAQQQQQQPLSTVNVKQ